MEGLTPKEADAWASEMTRIVGGTIHELIAAADKHNIDRDSAVQYYSDLFSDMASVATFEHYEMDGGADGKGLSVGCPEKSCQTGSFRTGCKEPRPDRLCHSAV